MKAALVQYDIVWADPEANRNRLDVLLEGIPQVDLIVLPEMFSTGFATQPEGVAEEAPSATLEWMKAKAREKDCAVAGSVALHEDGKYFNRFWFVKPSGEVTAYDKHHLFTYSGEHHRFTRGEKRVVAEWRGFRFLLNVCYDLRFPVWSRNRKDYDAAIYVASWPSVRQFPWDTLLRAGSEQGGKGPVLRVRRGDGGGRPLRGDPDRLRPRRGADPGHRPGYGRPRSLPGKVPGARRRRRF